MNPEYLRMAAWMSDDGYISHCLDILGGKPAKGFPDSIALSNPVFDLIQGGGL